MAEGNILSGHEPEFIGPFGRDMKGN